MTAEAAKANQDRLKSLGYDLAWWYGTRCKKCCGVFPKFMTSDGMNHTCWFQCEVCGRRTEPQKMPWIAEKVWNKGEFLDVETYKLDTLYEMALRGEVPDAKTAMAVIKAKLILDERKEHHGKTCSDR